MEMILKEKLEEAGICFQNQYEILYNNQCIVIPVKIEGELYFFKFLDKKNYNKMCLEVDIVNKLNENGIKVHKYYNLQGKYVFKDENMCFYGTKCVEDENMILNHNYDILCDVILNIAKMHNYLLNISSFEGEKVLEKSNDYIELNKFFESNRKFIYENGFGFIVNSVLQNGFETSHYSFIHYDLNFKNIMIKNNRFSGFIDFTDFKIGYLEDDLGKFFQNVVYLKNITDVDIYNLIHLYNQNSLTKISMKNLKTSIIYRIIYRYFCALNENAINEEYKNQTQKILKKINNL